MQFFFYLGNDNQKYIEALVFFLAWLYGPRSLHWHMFMTHMYLKILQSVHFLRCSASLKVFKPFNDRQLLSAATQIGHRLADSPPLDLKISSSWPQC